MEKVCPACGSIFECGSDNVLACGCTSVKLSKEDYQFIKETYQDCLCIKCLQQISKGTNLTRLV